MIFFYETIETTPEASTSFLFELSHYVSILGMEHNPEDACHGF